MGRGLRRDPGLRMAYYANHNLAYDFSLFEEREAIVAESDAKTDQKPEKAESRPKVNKPVRKAEPKKNVKRVRRRKSKYSRIALSILAGLAVVVAVVSIIHAQVQLTELNQEIADARSDLAEKQSVYTQLEMKVDTVISPSAVEQYAQETLNMSKASNSQKEFVTLSEGDKAEVIMSADKNIFERFVDLISSIWS